MPEARYALITGCGEGSIGHALAAQFQDSGFTVFATLLPHEGRLHLTDRGIHVFDANVTSDKDTEELLGKVQSISKGRLDVLVNNAGICYTMPATDTQVCEVEKMFAVNVFGPMRMVQYFHHLLVETQGTVVNVGSIGGIVPYIYGASYNASKAALHHYGNTLRAELKPFRVQVVNVISGEVGTNILRHDAARSLPTDSLYLPLADDFRNHVQRTPKTITPAQYAAAVVREVQKARPAAWFWYGPRTGMCRWGDMFLPRTYWDGLFAKWFHFEKLKRIPNRKPTVISMAFGISGVALVTGAGSGIGRDVAFAFAAEGATGVVFTDVNLEAAQRSADQSVDFAINPAYYPLALAVDVTDITSVQRMVTQAVDTFKQINYCVNSAGVGVREPRDVVDASMEEFDRFYRINVLGTMNCVKVVGAAMRQQTPLMIQGRNGERNAGRGAIVNLGSANSYMATRGIVQYTTSKHAVLGITRNAALELAADGVRVNTICPSWVDTPMVSAAVNGIPTLGPLMESVLPFRRIAQPEEVSDVILFLCSPRASYVTGSDWVVDGGMTLTVKT
ncbi:hypothetical protein PISL3812_09520 [Talaromyces islandicus]|uniref:Uncharacterized protein n=1 Tax=Talaromyces islandicus TaxID=28573 RepID=A0A0U1MBT3_TALIS|nr:hypothetical protein PISL3812_09520 [Talaromyces islandicus]